MTHSHPAFDDCIEIEREVVDNSMTLIQHVEAVTA